MALLNKGTVITTNYSHGHQFEVLTIKRDCRCARYSDELGLTKSGMEKESPKHLHITCKDLREDVGDSSKSYFNGYKEENGRVLSVWQKSDEIIIIKQPKCLQMELF